MLSLVDRLHKTYPDMGVMLSFDAEEGTRTEGAISYRIIKRPGWHIAVEEHIRTNTERWAQSEWRFSYPSEEGVSTISPADILYLTVEGGDGAKALTRNGLVTLGNTLSYWGEKTALLGFVRVHRSYLVNVRYIRSVTDREIVMAFDGEDVVGNTITIPYSSRRYKEVLMNRIKSLFPREDNP